MSELTPPEDNTDAIIAAGIRLAAVEVHRYRYRRIALASLALVAALGAALAYRFSRDDSPTTAPNSSASSAPEGAATSAVTSEASTDSVRLPPTVPVPSTTTTLVPPSTVTPPTTVPPSTTVAATTTTAFDPSIEGQFPWNYGVLQDGVLTLNGAVTTQEQAEAVKASAVALLSAQRVKGELAVDPAASGPTGIVRAAIRLDFAPDSDVIRDEFRYDLDLAVLILTLQPEAAIQIYGYTDNVGDAQRNLDLSARRVDAVIAYFTSNGIDPARIKGVPRGEANPIGDNNTLAGQRKNRRTELVFTNLFIG